MVIVFITDPRLLIYLIKQLYLGNGIGLPWVIYVNLKTLLIIKHCIRRLGEYRQAPVFTIKTISSI